MGLSQVILQEQMLLRDRKQAAQLLAAHLHVYAGENTTVLGIPRGGIVITDGIASELGCDLDPILAHKLGAPGNPELAIGAVLESGATVFDPRQTVPAHTTAYIEVEKERQLKRIEQQRNAFRSIKPKVDQLS